MTTGELHPGHEQESIAGLFTRVVDDGKNAARAEVALVQSGLKLRFARAKAGLVMAVLALVILHLALIAGAVELAAALATLIGPGFAGLAVLIGGILVAYMLVRMAVARITPAFGALDDANGSTAS